MRNRAVRIITIVILLLSSCSNYPQYKPALEAFVSPTFTATNTVNPTSTAIVTPTMEPTKSPVISVTRSDCLKLTIDWQGTPSANPNKDSSSASIPISEVESLSQEEIVVALFCQYLEKFVSPITEIVWRIVDYRMEIGPANYSRGWDEILFYREFYVLPVNPDDTYWIAGAAARLNDGWIMNGAYSSIVKDEEYYKIAGFFNG